MKKWFNYFTYISFAFLLFALSRADYLRVPEVQNPLSLAGSLFLLFTSFLVASLSWQQLLHHSGLPIKYRSAVASTGLSIFGKYIPGSIWTIVGRSGYLATRQGYPLDQLTSLSVDAQAIRLWTGLLAGSLGFFYVDKLQQWSWVVLLTLGLLTAFLLTDIFHLLGEKLTKRFLNKPLKLPRLTIAQLIQVAPLFLFYWLCLNTGFYLLANSVAASSAPYFLSFGYALSSALGTMAIVAPGGLGVREGLLFTYLLLAGLSTPEATTLSVFSRLWFLLGEAFIFGIGAWLDRARPVVHP